MSERQDLEREIKADLKSQGYSIKLLDSWPARTTYYKPSGEPMHNLPADPFSMKSYLKRGFTLEPPEKKKAAETDPLDDLLE